MKPEKSEDTLSQLIKREDEKPPLGAKAAKSELTEGAKTSLVKDESTKMEDVGMEQKEEGKIPLLKKELIKGEDVKMKQEDIETVESQSTKLEDVNMDQVTQKEGPLLKAEDVKMKQEDTKMVPIKGEDLKPKIGNTHCLSGVDVEPSKIEPESKMEVEQAEHLVKSDTAASENICPMQSPSARHVSFAVSPEVGLEVDDSSDSPATRRSERLSSPPPAERSPTRSVETPQSRSATPPEIIIKDEPVDVDMDLSSTPMEARPEKRHRVFMDAVIIPTLASVRRAEAERKEIHRKLELLRNPIVKKPKNTPTLCLDTVRARLEPIGYDLYPIDLEKDIRDVTVRRDFMSEHYGGNPQETYPKISATFVEKTGMEFFMYLNLFHNPYCPEVPGAPGLLFDAICADEYSDSEPDDNSDNSGGGSNRSDDDSEGSNDEDRGEKDKGEDKNNEDEDKKDEDKLKPVEEDILFARLDQSTWQYQGQYVRAPAPPLTVEEWKQQPLKVRNTWASQLSTKRWGQTIRTDIVLRRQLGRKPTKHETRAARKSGNKFFNVTPEEISSAFDRGEAIIVVSTLKCVGYNADFQRDLAAKIPFFVPKERKQRPKKGVPKTKGKQAVKVEEVEGKQAATANGKQAVKANGKQAVKGKRNAAPGPRGRKRKREESLSDEEDNGFENDSDVVPESEDEDLYEVAYRPRGTRSRPIVVA